MEKVQSDPIDAYFPEWKPAFSVERKNLKQNRDTQENKAVQNWTWHEK